MIKIYILIILIFYLLIYNTPICLINYLYLFIFKDINLYYNNKLLQLHYTFNHKDYDGELMNFYIKNLIYKKEKKEKKVISYDFKSYQYINCNRILNYSLFTSSVAHLLKKIMNYQNRKKIVAGIVISTRKFLKDKTRKGNYLKFVKYTIYDNNTIYDISNIHNKNISNIKNNKQKILHTTLADIIKLYNVDYIFNSWRNLSVIKTIDNNLLTRINTKNILEKDIKNFYNINNKYFIVLDFLNNKYIISNLFKIN